MELKKGGTKEGRKELRNHGKEESVKERRGGSKEKRELGEINLKTEHLKAEKYWF